MLRLRRRLHQGFVDAGSDIILTNSFGGNARRLALHKAEGRVFELNRLAAQHARAVADASGRRVIVAGSVGPTGDLFAPLGALTEPAGFSCPSAGFTNPPRARKRPFAGVADRAQVGGGSG